MSDLRDLYQEVILDHNRRPRNFGPLPAANRRAEGHNPLCGDRVTVYLDVAADRIRDVAFEGAGCAISTASASLMTEALKGLGVEEARGAVPRLPRAGHQGRGRGARTWASSPSSPASASTRCGSSAPPSPGTP